MVRPLSSRPNRTGRRSGRSCCVWRVRWSASRSPTWTSRRWTTSTSAGWSPRCARRPDTPLTGRDPEQAIAALTGRGPERLVDLGIRLGPWGDDLGQRPGGLTLDEVRRHPERPATGRTCRRPARRRGVHPFRHSRIGPPTARRRPAPATREARAPCRGPGADQPPASALEQLLAAQRACVDAGQGPLHTADPPRRRRDAPECGPATSPRCPPREGALTVTAESVTTR